MSAHTPGPWSIYRAHICAGGRGNHVAAVGRPEDARLIAAAPDLLAALEALVAGVEDAGPVGCGNCVDPITRHTGNIDCAHTQEVGARMGRARAAIAKARGQ